MTSKLPDPADRPNDLPWPPILYGVALLVPFVLQRIIELPRLSLSGILGMLLPPLGWALVATGVMIGYLAIRSFSAVGTAIHPTHAATELVTFGLYNRTRNPMYLAGVLAFAGLAIATGNLWRFAAVPLLVYGLMTLAIFREEAHLAARFGSAWEAYKNKTPRWW